MFRRKNEDDTPTTVALPRRPQPMTSPQPDPSRLQQRPLVRPDQPTPAAPAAPPAPSGEGSTGFSPQIQRRLPDLPGLGTPGASALGTPGSEGSATLSETSILRPSASETPTPPKAEEPPMAAPEEEKKLTVGRNIRLTGQITACDKLLVEGTVEATLSESRVIEVSQTGTFSGSAEIDEAVISGTFDGSLLVRGRLLIRSTGKVRGEVRYGQLEIECGGELVGTINTVKGEPLTPATTANATAAAKAAAAAASSPAVAAQ
ncbi:polymer-forming cytoskeletal protein [Zavarzinia sp. CC-PAN008]|uniref:bactofilin family protein n=1 Tax=Zavarzinia sp. CC-PAN008 TaxID=3243332 RepID=UPI003F742ADA